MPLQTYINTHAQYKHLQSTHPSKSLLHFVQLQFLFSHSNLHDESILVRSMPQTYHHICAQSAESARIGLTQYSALDTMYYTLADSLITGPCLPHGQKSVLLATQHAPLFTNMQGTQITNSDLVAGTLSMCSRNGQKWTFTFACIVCFDV